MTRKTAERRVSDQLQQFTSALLNLSRSTTWHSGDRRRAFRELCEKASDALRVARVSVWLLDDSRSKLVCENLLDTRDQTHSSGAELRRSDYPIYFSALDDQRTIAAIDAANHPLTREFAADYLSELGIDSMLDAPIMMGGRSVGVICHEQVGRRRSWTRDEESFAASIGEFAALTLEAELRRSAEKVLQTREQELRIALKAAAMGTWSWSLSSNRVVCSEEVGEILGREYGWSPASHEEFFSIIHPSDRDRVAAEFGSVIRHPELQRFLTYRIMAPDGSIRWIETRGQLEQRSPSGGSDRLLGTMSDCTAYKKLEDQLHQAQRMEGIGQLAGGIAHDFNNLLTVITGFAQVLLDDSELGEDERGSAQMIADASERGAQLTRQLLAFARQQPLKVTRVDLATLVDGVSQLLERMVGDDVTIVIRAIDRPTARVDVGQVEQVLMNLCINARDAISGRGEIAITVSSHELSGSTVECPLPAGRYACIDVVDQGPGIPPEDLDRIFEPFFTTKPAGKGTGLGLSTCYGIARQLGGDIFVRSVPGEGTRFRVLLPEDDVDDVSDDDGVVASRKSGAGRLVLLVEDDEMVRLLNASVLEQAGYRVLTAADGDEAHAVMRAAGRPVDLVVADVVLPGRTGPSVLEELRKLQPSFRSLLVSGHVMDSSEEAEILKGDFLEKPFKPNDLLAMVGEILDR
ncbi:MAG: ATP-binding protein [bacterium]|nr:ATP-binding protein [bacterium]